MKNLFNEAVVSNPQEVKGGTLFLLSWLFGGFGKSKSYGGGHGHGGGHGGGCKCGSKW